MRAPLIPHNWQLPDYFRGRLGSNIGRQRAMQWEKQILLVTHQLPKPDDRTRVGQLFWRDDQGKWLCSNGMAGPAALEKLISQYQHALDQFEQQSNQVNSSREYLTILEALGPIDRAARGLYETLQQAREANADAREIIDWRDKIEEMMLELDQLYADVKTAMEVALIRGAEQQAELTRRVEHSAHRLNILAALFFPLATMGSVLGTTLTEGWSWSQGSLPFGTFLVVGALCGIGLVQYVSAYKR